MPWPLAIQVHECIIISSGVFKHFKPHVLFITHRVLLVNFFNFSVIGTMDIYEQAWKELTESEEFKKQLNIIIAELTAIRELEKRPLTSHYS